MTHWATSLIGRPYKPKARGPQGFDCWGLCAYVWQTYFGIEDVPDIAIDPQRPRAVREEFARAIEEGEGHQVPVPFEGCAVLMSRARLPDHVGIYLAVDGGGVLHAIDGLGVVFTEFGSLEVNGLRVLGFYRPRGMSWPTSR